MQHVWVFCSLICISIGMLCCGCAKKQQTGKSYTISTELANGPRGPSFVVSDAQTVTEIE